MAQVTAPRGSQNPLAPPAMPLPVPSPAKGRPLEDPLAYLPCSKIMEYKKGSVIYAQGDPVKGIYLVIDGNVKVSRLAAGMCWVVVDIYHAEEFFGESAFRGLPHCTDQAEAMGEVKLMTWTAEEIAEIIARRPKLATALLQALSQRIIDFGDRLESFAVDTIIRRLARALIRFSERLGTPEEPDSAGGRPVHIMALTHEVLSQYVGTSREIVTHYMNHFRRQGYLKYSRKGILLYREALQQWLRQNA